MNRPCWRLKSCEIFKWSSVKTLCTVNFHICRWNYYLLVMVTNSCCYYLPIWAPKRRINLSISPMSMEIWLPVSTSVSPKSSHGELLFVLSEIRILLEPLSNCWTQQKLYIFCARNEKCHCFLMLFKRAYVTSVTQEVCKRGTWREL